MLVFNPKEGQFCDTGTVESWSPENDGLGPRDYYIRMESGSMRKVNSSWLSPLPGAENPQVVHLFVHQSMIGIHSGNIYSVFILILILC